MQRIRNNDRGASSIGVALLMIPLLIIAALAIDAGALYAAKQQLQTGADAGALAIAQECARDDCSTPNTTAQTMAASNFTMRGDANGAIIALDEAAGTVSVETDTVREHVFAPIIGINSTTVQETASARWGYPTGGTSVLPLAFSWCELAEQSGITVQRDPNTGEVVGVDIPSETAEHTINLSKSSDTDCTGPSGNLLPGGFGWLSPDPSDCGKTVSVIDGWVASDTGNSVPSPCTDTDFRQWIGETVLLPIFDRARGTGSSGEYEIYGYAAFTLTGYYFAGQYRYPSQPPCRGNARCISGSFDRFVDLTEDFDYSPSGPRLGAAVVALTRDAD